MKRKEVPNFLSKRIHERFQHRFNTEWGGVNLFKVNPKDDNDVILCSNDYLGLCDEEKLHLSNKRDRTGEKIMSSVLLNETSYQAEVERAFTEFFGTEDSIMCQSGYAANTGLIQAIANEDTPVYIDILAHMSLHDGVRLAGATSHPFAHNSAESARKKIARHGPGIVVVDTVYSSNGSMCPIADFVALAEETGCVLVVDESHSAGTHGPQGRGVVYEQGLTDKVDFITASLAKTFAGRGGLITCPTIFKDYFQLESHPSLFSSSVMNYDLKWFMDAIEYIKAADKKREKLHAHSKYLRSTLDDLGYDVSGGSEQIISLEIGSEKEVMSLKTHLESNGILATIFCYPATTKNKGKVRLTANANLSNHALERIVDAFREYKKMTCQSA